MSTYLSRTATPNPEGAVGYIPPSHRISHKCLAASDLVDEATTWCYRSFAPFKKGLLDPVDDDNPCPYVANPP